MQGKTLCILLLTSCTIVPNFAALQFKFHAIASVVYATIQMYCTSNGSNHCIHMV